MTRKESELMFEQGLMDDQYANYIMDNCGGDRLICNGDMLIDAMEEGYLSEEFIDSLASE